MVEMVEMVDNVCNIMFLNNTDCFKTQVESLKKQ